MVFNATFNNISAISLRSALLVEEIGISGETHRPVASIFCFSFYYMDFHDIMLKLYNHHSVYFQKKGLYDSLVFT